MKKKLVFVALILLFSVSFIHAEYVSLVCTRYVIDGNDYALQIQTVFGSIQDNGNKDLIFYFKDGGDFNKYSLTNRRRNVSVKLTTSSPYVLKHISYYVLNISMCSFLTA
jgi:hypothetical protein